MTKSDVLRRSGIKIMSSLTFLMGSLLYVMVFAIVNGTVGFICAMGVTISGAVGVAKVLGDNIGISYNAIIFIGIICGVLRGFLRYIEQYTNHYIAFKTLAVLRDKIFQALRMLCPAKLETKKKGSIIAMITSDIETLEVFYAHTISPICIAVLVSALVIVFVGIESSWVLSVVALFGYLCVGVFIPAISSDRLKSSGVKYREEFSQFNAYFLDSIKGIKDLVLNNAGIHRKYEVDRRSEELLTETKKMKHISSKFVATTELCVSLFILISLFVGMILVLNNILTPGRMIIGVVTVFGSFGPVIAISALPSNLTQTLASGDRMLDLLSEKPSVYEVTKGSDMSYNYIDISNLSFSYDGESNILDDICLYAEKGEIVGIVGSSGCGKSTLLKLLLRFWEKRSGSIKYGETDIDDINTSSLLENVTMVSQTTYLFDDTIETNLRIAKPNATMEDIENACKMASIHDFISSLPDGYSTMVGPLGDRLSAGEKQRIGLARAFLRGSDLILLDEPTSNVDSINEGIILNALRKQKRKKSIIMVSHRESTTSIADRIYLIEKGKIYERKRKQ